MPTLITDPIFYLVAIPAVILLGLSKGGFAGIGAATTPLMALYLPPLEAAALILPVLILQDLISLYVYRRDWDASNIRIMLPGALVGMGIAWLLAAYISDNAVRIVIAVIVLGFLLNSWLQRANVEPRRGGTVAGVFWGGVSGFTSFMSQAGAPPFQIYVLPQRLPKLVFVGTTTVFFTIVNALKIGPYFALGQFHPDNLVTSIVLIPIAVAANFAGIWLVKHMPTGIFYKISYVLLLAISLALLWQGSSGMLH